VSLFGTGRREGVCAVLLLGVIVVLAHLLGFCLAGAHDHADPTAGAHEPAAVATGELPMWFASEQDEALLASPLGENVPGAAFLPPVAGAGWRLVMAAVAALACITFYRFLRAHQRTRYTAFLGAGAYGLGATFVPPNVVHEAAAAACVPFALEAVLRMLKPSLRRRWSPLLGLGLALPFLAGGLVIGSIGALGVLGLVLGSLPRVERDDQRPLLRGAGVALLLAVLIAAPAWLHLSTAGMPVSTHVVPLPGTTTAAWLAVAGAFTLFLVPLGLLRRQRYARALPCLMIVAAGIALAALPERLLPAGGGDLIARLAVAGRCTAQLGLLVFGAGTLDDFLEAPHRGRPLLLVLVGLGMFAVVAAVADRMVPTVYVPHLAPALPIIATAAAMATTALLWRRLGILRFKSALAIVALLGFAVPAVHSLSAPAELVAHPAAPLGETQSHGGTGQRLPDSTLVAVLGLSACAVGVATALLLAAFARQRRRALRHARAD